MIKKIMRHCAVMAVTALMLAACGAKNEWTVTGRIEDADGQTMVLEANDGNGRWYALDSVRLDASGRFTMSQPPAGYPDIYRLRLAGKTLYFPIDSIETLTVISRAGAFDSEYQLEGSAIAQQMMDVDRRLLDVASRCGVRAVCSDSLLKHDLATMMLDDSKGLVSYYIINKRIDGQPIFDPGNSSDLRLIGAVANAFDRLRPNDPRTAWLKNFYLANKRLANHDRLPSDTIHAPEITHFDIRLYDEAGHQRSLSDMVGKGHPVLLNFTVYQADAAPVFNMRLNEIYSRWHESRGLEIYQVSVDEDEYLWREAARALPWVTVYNAPDTESRNLLNYNVTDIPVFFIFNGAGEIVERINDVNELDDALRRHF